MEFIDVASLKENDIVKLINPNKTLFDGRIKKISTDFLGITINTRQDTYRELNKNQFIELILIYKHEALKCSSIILGSILNNSEQAIVISIPKLLLGIGRRIFERIPIVMDIEYSLLPRAEVNYENLSNVPQKFFRFSKKLIQ